MSDFLSTSGTKRVPVLVKKLDVQDGEPDYYFEVGGEHAIIENDDAQSIARFILFGDSPHQDYDHEPEDQK